MKKIAFKEVFRIYVYVDHKQAPSLIKALKKQGFKPKEKDFGDDHEISVDILPVRAAEVISIFNIYT